MINTANIQSFTDAQLLSIARQAYAAVLIGKSYTGPDGRVLTREDAAAIQDAIEWLEERIQDVANAANGIGGNVALAQFGEPNTSGAGAQNPNTPNF